MLNIPIFAPNLVSFPIHNNENSCQKRWLPYIGGGEGWGICVNWECHVLIYSPSCTSSIVNFHLFKITLDKPIYRVLTLFKECNSMTFQWPITYFPWPMQLKIQRYWTFEMKNQTRQKLFISIILKSKEIMRNFHDRLK